jgi:hypothetical protein
MSISEAIHTLSCPSCGGNIKYVPGLSTITCAWCGSTVVVPAGEQPRRAFAPGPEPLATRVAQLVQAGHDGRAVQLLRDELGLSLQDAGQAVERIRVSEGKDVERVIREAASSPKPLS